MPASHEVCYLRPLDQLIGEREVDNCVGVGPREQGGTEYGGLRMKMIEEEDRFGARELEVRKR